MRHRLPGKRCRRHISDRNCRISNRPCRLRLRSWKPSRAETQAQGALAVSAPVSGVIAAQLVEPGQSVQIGQPLLSLLPGDGKLEAELLIYSQS